MQIGFLRRVDWGKTGLGVLVILALALIPLLVTVNPFYQYMVNLVLIYGIVAMGLNVLVGYAGQISIGHAAFYGIGGYSAALLSTRVGLPFFVSLPLGGLITGVAGYLIGYPVLRLRGNYLGVATLGLGAAVPEVAMYVKSLTGGYMGLQVPRPSIGQFSFDVDTRYYYIIVICFLFFYLTTRSFLRRKTGRAFMAIRDSEVAAQAMGVNVAHYKCLAFALSAAYAGVAGGLYAHMIGFISPIDFGIEVSFSFLAMIIVGGLSSLPGSLLGASFMVIVPQLTSGLKGLSSVAMGLALVMVVLFCPRGISQLIARVKAGMQGRGQN